MSALFGFLMIFLIGCISLIGLVFISMKEKTLDRILFFLVAFATGTILASAIFDLIPEAFHHLEEYIEMGYELDEITIFYFIMIGYLVFFVIERFIYWFHGHAHQETEDKFVCYDDMLSDKPMRKEGTKVKNFAILNLIGDGMHNFLDGIIIMIAFLTSPISGIIVTLAVLAHELPQEIGDFGILLMGGLTRKNALIANFSSGMIAMLGGLFALLMTDAVDSFNLFFLAFSGGGFLYLACTELMPEIMQEKDLKKSIIQTFLIISGILLILILLNVLPHE